VRFSGITRRGRAAVAIAAALLVAVSACSSSSSPSKKASGSATPTSTPTPTGTALFPAVKGAYGVKPTLTFPNANPSKTLQVKVLSEGTGPVVAKGELLIADYLGQIWRGKVFDNSYDRKAPIATPIGLGQVIKGWDDGLVGKRVGSRVLLVIPPADGYGSAGSSGAGIKGTDTLAFVVDLISTYSKTDVGDKKAVVQPVVTAPVTVTGALGARPTIKIATGAALPTAAKTVVLAKSTGAPIKAGFVVLQYEAEYYNNTLADSTFLRGQPQGTSIGVSGQANPFDGLIGVPIGSRVLITTPVQDQEGNTTGVAIVADIIAQSGPAKP
jgi:peptidylprolyl isomerase